MSKSVTVVFILVLAYPSMFMIGTVNAQSTSKPSVPDFNLTYHATLYYYPPKYAIDPYTGENITASYEHWVRQTSVEVAIQDQPFTPYEVTDIYGVTRTVNLYFGVRSKGHFEDQWIEPSIGNYQIADYTAKQTIIYLYGDSTPKAGQIDFQVQAYIGYKYWEPNTSLRPIYFFFEGTNSGWSSTQTLTFNDPNGGAGYYFSLPSGLQSTTAVTPPVSQTSNPSPTVSELPFLVVLPLLVAVPLIVAIFLKRKTIPQTT